MVSVFCENIIFFRVKKFQTRNTLNFIKHTKSQIKKIGNFSTEHITRLKNTDYITVII
jgi:hypothetical protein